MEIGIAYSTKKLVSEDPVNAEKIAREHGDVIADGVDKTTDFIDTKTGGKFSDHLDSVEEAVRGFVNNSKK